jgi:hypothetical protein
VEQQADELFDELMSDLFHKHPGREDKEMKQSRNNNFVQRHFMSQVNKPH